MAQQLQLASSSVSLPRERCRSLAEERRHSFFLIGRIEQRRERLHLELARDLDRNVSTAKQNALRLCDRERAF